MRNTTPNDKRRARVLQLAYACSPWKGSEPGVGWNRAVEAAKYSDVWVITEGNEFKHQVLGYLDEVGDIDGLNFIFLGKTRFEESLSRIPGCYYIAYNLWHRRAYQVAKQYHEEVGFDLAHQVNMCGYREPGLLWKLGPPFIWGPIGGTQNYPWWLMRQAGIRGAIEETIRSFTNWLQLRLSRRVRVAAKRASLVLLANSTINRQFASVVDCNSRVMCETGTKSVQLDDTKTDEQGELRLLWAGEFRAFKALPLLLDAIASAKCKANIRLRVMGDGSQRKRWLKIAERLGIAEQIEWLGWLPHREALQQYEWADLFAFTSLRDTSGNVVFEALSRGVPVVAIDHQGVGDIVTEASGFKVPLGNEKEIVAGFQETLDACFDNRDLLQDKSRDAVQRANDFLWRKQGEKMRTHYRGVLGEEFEWKSRYRANDLQASQSDVLEREVKQ